MAKINDISMQTGFPMPGSNAGNRTESEGNGFSDIMQKARKAEQEANDDLMSLTGRQSSNPSDRKSERPGKAEDVRADRAKEDKPKTESTKKEQKSGQPDKVEKPSANPDAKKADDKAVAQAAEEITEEIADELDVDEEEILLAMELLGLNAADLVQPGNTAELMAQVLQIDSVDIVTSEELTDLVQSVCAEVTETLEEAADDLGISVEELMEEIESRQTIPEQEASFETQAEGPGEPVAELRQPAAADIRPADVNETAVRDEGEAEPAQVADTAQSAGQIHTEQGSRSEGSGAGNKKEKNEGRMQNAAQEQAAAPVQTDRQAEPMVESRGVADRLQESLDAARTQEVIDQIAEHVRVNHSDRATGIDMMLNPANLGSIRLQLESDNGVIRGQLTASDDAVRAALESHLIQLREALAEQGMKVDAIEVTVAEHKMEENRDQEGKRDEQQAEEQAGSIRSLRSNRRILDLNEVDGDEEAQMSEAERLEIEMMRMGGNRLNLNV